MTLRLFLRYFFAFIILLLVLLPWFVSVAVKQIVVGYLDDQGLQNVQIERLWINPYLAKLTVDGFQFNPADSQQALRVDQIFLDLSVSALVDRKVKINALIASGIDLQLLIDAERTLLNGIDMVATSDESRAESETVLEASAVQNEQTDSPESSPWHFAIESFQLRDIRTQIQTPDLDIQARINHILIENIDTLQGLTGQLDLDISVDAVQLDQLAVVSLGLELLASTKVLLSQNRGIEVSIRPELQLKNLNINSAGYQIDLASVAMDANAFAHFNPGLIAYDSSIALQIGKVKLAVEQAEGPPLQIAQLAEFSTQIEVNSEAINISATQISDLMVLQSQSDAIPTLLSGLDLSTNHITIEQFTSTEPMRIRVDNIVLARAQLSLLRTEDGSMPQFAALTGEQEADKASAVEGAEVADIDIQTPIETGVDTAVETRGEAGQKLDDSSAPIDLQIAGVSITDGVKIHFEDRSLSPSFSEVLGFNHFELTDLRPLDETHLSQIDAQLSLSHEASLELLGELSLTADNADLSATLSSYQLLQASGFGVIYTGYALESGTLNLDSDIVISDSQLNIVNQILIDQLSLRAANDNETLRIANQLSMPLDQMLDLLRNKDNEINLNLPITGAMDTPDFDIQDLINTAMAGAIKKASISLLKNLLQPYSTALTIAQIAGGQLTKISLDPVTFENGHADLPEPAIDYMMIVAGMLTQKDSLKIKICGVTNLADKTYFSSVNSSLDEKALTNQLHELATARAAALRDYLIQQLAAEPRQLLACLPNHSEKEDATSGVEMNI